MMRATAKGPLTAIKELLRSSIGERLLMPPNREKPSVAVRIRADRTFPGEVAIVEALTAEVPSRVVAIALLEEVSGAVKRGNKATEVLQAVKARPQEGAVVPEVVAGPPVAEEGAPAAVVAEEGAPVAAVVGADRNRQTA
jgi:hypothetical protein